MNIFKNGISAHRGNSGRFPENTVESFLSGIAAGTDWLELDIRYTADKQLVVVHDDTSGRTADEDLVIAETALSELKKLDFAFQFRKNKPDIPVLRIPTLREIFEAVGAGAKTGISIQPKNSGAEGILAIEKTVSLAEELGMMHIIGFNDGQLDLMRHVKKINRNIPVFYDICYPQERHLAEAVKYGFESLICRKDNITEDWAPKVKAKGVIPGAWTVNSIEEFNALSLIGVKRFYTDYPEKLLKAIDCSS
jgi:glycerophosphoryl diester phosphodiesterase